jgi:multiple sugar transport system ATP-binding protein
VFQNYALYANMTVRDNLGFALRVAKTDKAAAKQRVEEVAATLDLTEHLDRKPAKLSGGQRQRVAMGRAIVREPRAFLMDEPLSNLDAKLRVQMRGEIARLQSRLSTTTIYVTHDQTEAMTLGDRVVVLRGGQVQQIGTPEELYHRPVNQFVAGFIGSPPMSFVPAQVREDRLELPFGSVPASRDLVAAAKGRELVAGFRAEHFEDAAYAGDRPGLRFSREPVVVEALGAEDFAYFDEGDVEVVARLSPHSRARPRQPLELVLDTTRTLLFDAGDGQRVVATVGG